MLALLQQTYSVRIKGVRKREGICVEIFFKIPAHAHHLQNNWDAKKNAAACELCLNIICMRVV